MQKNSVLILILVTATSLVFAAQEPEFSVHEIATYKTPQKSFCKRFFQTTKPEGYAPALDMQIIKNKTLCLNLVDGSYVAWDIKTKKYLGNAKRDTSAWEPVSEVKPQFLSCCNTIMRHDSAPQVLGHQIEDHIVRIFLMTQKQ